MAALKKNCCDLNLGESLCIFTFFLFPDSRINLLNGFDFIFIYFEWRDTENSHFRIFLVIERTERTQLNAAHAQLLEKLRLSAFVETCRFQTIQSLEFQEIWQKKWFKNHVNDLSQKI